MFYEILFRECIDEIIQNYIKKVSSKASRNEFERDCDQSLAGILCMLIGCCDIGAHGGSHIYDLEDEINFKLTQTIKKELELVIEIVTVTVSE